MAAPTKASDIDLAPIPGKRYLSLTREWREEFIYFLMIDRFHDDQSRAPVLQAGRSNGISTPDDFFGVTLKGVTTNLDYIAGLGCTAICLSPVFENNAKAYHGYDISNYLSVDPRFGTEQDLIDLVEAAHNFKKSEQPFPIRIILDVVINHSGDNWEYAGGPKGFLIRSWRLVDSAAPAGRFQKNCATRTGIIAVAVSVTSMPRPRKNWATSRG